MARFGPYFSELPRTAPGIPVAITAATNANPAKLTFGGGAIRHGYRDNDNVILAGATGSWAPINGTFPVQIVDAFSLTIQINSTGFGALTGAVTATRPSQAQVDGTSWDRRVDDSKNWKENVNGGGHVLSNVTVMSGSAGLQGASALSFPTIADQDYQALTFSLPGAVVNDPVAYGWPAALEAGLFGLMLVVSSGVVEVRLFNFSGHDISPATLQTFQATSGLGALPGVAALSFPLITDQDNAALTFLLPGSLAGDRIVEGWPPTLEAGLFGRMRVPSDGVCEVRLFNFSGHDLTPAPSQVFKGINI